MKNYILGLLLICGFSISSLAYAENIAVADIEKIKKESLAGKDIIQQVKTIQDKYQNEIDKKEESLRKKEEELKKQKSTISAEAFQEQVKKFNNDLIEGKKLLEKRTIQLKSADAEALNELGNKTMDIAKEIANAKAVSIVIPKAHALYVKDSLDITDDIIKELDKRYPKIKVTIEEVAPKKKDKEKEKKE